MMTLNLHMENCQVDSTWASAECGCWELNWKLDYSGWLIKLYRSAQLKVSHSVLKKGPLALDG